MATYTESPGQAPSPLLVPVLPTQGGPPDAVTVAAWHLALSNLVGVEVPHDLLALWLFPACGGVVLLAPSELASDRVELQPPDTRLSQHELLTLEDRIRHAGYRSVIAVPVRGPTRDLGLALFARLEAGHLGPPEAIRLHGVVQQLVPTFLALVEAPPLPRGAPAVVTERNAVEAVARAAAEARTAPEVLRLVSGELHALVPHEVLEVAVPGRREGAWALLSAANESSRWSDSPASVAEAVAQLVRRAAPDGTLLLPDLRATGLRWPAYRETRSALRVRSVAGARLSAAGAADAWLLLGGQAPGMFREADLAMLRAIAPVLAMRVHGLRATLDADVARAEARTLGGVEHHAARIASHLAHATQWRAALAAVAQEVREALGFARMRVVLRVGEAEVVELDFDEPAPERPLPLLPLDPHPLAPVLRGTRPDLSTTPSHLAVPLRVAGQIIGALEFLHRTAPLDVSGQVVADAALLADVVAPHVELMRRASLGQRSPPSPPPKGESGHSENASGAGPPPNPAEDR